MHSSAPPGIPPELPAAHGPLPSDDETARLPLPVSVLSPWAASNRPAGALSPTDVALFPTSPCTAEGQLEGGEPHASYPFPREVPRQTTLRAFRPHRRALLSTRGGLFILF
jgi:hypothetical protein